MSKRILYRKIETQTTRFSLVLFITSILLLTIPAMAIYDNETGSQWPTKSHIISSPFGPRLKASENYRYDYHRGLDIPGKSGVDEVYAMADGKVYRVYSPGDPNNPYENSGKTVIIAHNINDPILFHEKNFTQYYTLYMHLDKILVANGAIVKKGDVIGILGKTGNTSFEHLHFEIRIGTTCSREYQIANPTTKCAQTFNQPEDPAVNPYMFLPYLNKNSLNVSIIGKYPLKIRVTSDRDELDFNEIKITNGNKTKKINLNTREGISMSIDNNFYNGVRILPQKFNSAASKYIIDFEIPEWNTARSIEVSDIWGNKLAIKV